jgi:MHS family citrate/tricarballylate:H+ symporter-like MFS transporter
MDRREKILSVVRVSSGNFLEMYDFFVFGYYAPSIGRVFFPVGSAFASVVDGRAVPRGGTSGRPLAGVSVSLVASAAHQKTPAI